MIKILLLLMIASLLLGGCGKSYYLELSRLEQGSAWPFHHGKSNAASASDVGVFNGKLNVIWEANSHSRPAAGATLYYGLLVYPGTKERIRFYDRHSGEYQGYLKPKGTPQTGLVAKGRFGFFGLSPTKNLLKCVDLHTGKTIWRKRLSDPLPGPIIDDNRLLVSSAGGLLYAIDPGKGDVLWEFTAEGRLTAAPSAADGRVYVSDDQSLLYAVSSKDGEEIYRVEMKHPLLAPVAVGGDLFAADFGGNVYGIRSESGEIFWTIALEGTVRTSPALSANSVLISLSDGELVALDRSNGAERWRFPTYDVIGASATVVGDYIIVSTLSGRLFSLRESDGTLLDERHLAGAISYPAISDGNLIYVITQNGSIICFGNNDEQIKQVN